MSTDSMARKNYKWLSILLFISSIALLSTYYTTPSTSSYSYYRRAVFYRDDSELETTNTSVMSWTDGNGKTCI